MEFVRMNLQVYLDAYDRHSMTMSTTLSRHST